MVNIMSSEKGGKRNTAREWGETVKEILNMLTFLHENYDCFLSAWIRKDSLSPTYCKDAQ